MRRSADGFRGRTRPLAVLVVLTTLCALLIDCTAANHDDHHVGSGTVAMVADIADVVVPDHPLPDHCLPDVAGSDSALVLLVTLIAILLVVVAAWGLPALAGRGPPRAVLWSRPGRDILTHFCICRR
ncbi:hypothetical protein BOX37_11295 [Nocardia mangyaensis]|uniref:Lipoprotein LpqS n=1 Tax=Nocardia mangyaensis TaxID=2213200 RepID=A0A1J0VQZ4_9NOCA|nr:hypothetical protein [Nocardia mangyaensis]APE34445.1 hypothetical protein BOX37_11295 [Nocardia mangyaensis]